MPPAIRPPEVVEDVARLREVVALLRRHPRVAVDTESNSLYAYRERVCLIQASIPETDFLIDPLSLSDLSPLGSLFTSSRIEKVFHAADYDLICLHRDFGFHVTNLFDTRIATRTLGRTQTGLGDILAEEFGVQIDKRYQRADWGKRPLPAHLLDYARLDTHYLLALRERLGSALESAGRLQEAREACEYIARAVPNADNTRKPSFWDITHARQLRPEQAAVLRELYQFRESQARRLDRPPFKVLGDPTLLAIARAMPSEATALAAVTGMNPRLVQRFGESILAAIARGHKAPRPRLPRNQPADPAVLARYERLRRWRKRVADARRVESDLVLPRETLWEIARAAPHDLRALQPLLDGLRWRFETYGAELLQALWAP
jgi:ribonuclease D